MRGQPGPCLTPGNYPAARRFIRNRKPPPIILWTIGIITCLLFIGAIAMLTVGYLNPFGTVGLAILGVGAVVYFGAILFLVLSCLWVERKYPGMQPLSFKIYSRKPNRMPPTTFTNPNISGQIPANTTPSYRMHTELPIPIPGSNNVGEKIDESQEEKVKPSSHGSLPRHAENPTGEQTALDILKEAESNGIGEDDIPDIGLQANTDNVNMNEHTRDKTSSAIGTDLKLQSQQEQLNTKNAEGPTETPGKDQIEIDNNLSASPKRERKVQLKTHHIEVPLEDYPSSDSSTSVSNKKHKAQDTQEANSKNSFENISSITEKDNSPTAGASKSQSSTKVPAMDKQKEASLNSVSHTRDARSHQRAHTAEYSTVKDIKQETSKPSTTHKTKFIEKDETYQENHQSPSNSPAHARKQIPGKLQANQERRGLTTTNSASPPSAKKITDCENQFKPTNPVQKDSALAPKSSPLNARKLLDGQINNVSTSNYPLRKSVQEKIQTSIVLKTRENMFPQKNNLTHDHQNMATSPKHHITQRSPGGSPTRVQKTQSPERTQKIRIDNTVTNSPPTNRKTESSSSPPRHPQKRIGNINKGPERTQVQGQSITIQTLSSGGRKEELQKKNITHSSPYSQSDDFTSSSSPPRQHQRSPNKSPRLQRNGDHRRPAFHSREGRHSSPSSQSSDVPSSPSSSPQRAHRKSPNLSTNMQTHKSVPVTGMLSSSGKKEELHKRISHPSSQSSDVSSSPPSSAKELLQYKKEPTKQNKSVPQQTSTNK